MRRGATRFALRRCRGAEWGTTSDAPSTPFEHLDDVVALPRLSGLALSPDGHRLVTGVATLHPDGDRYVTSLWEVDARGEAPADSPATLG